MAVRTKSLRSQNVYLRLVREFPLRPIRSGAEHDRAIKMIDHVMKRGSLSQQEEDYLQVLTDLISAYEDETDPILPVPDKDMLGHLIESRQLTQAEVAKRTGIVESTISAVLSGKRTLSRSHIAKLAKFFRVSPEVFASDGG